MELGFEKDLCALWTKQEAEAVGRTEWSWAISWELARGYSLSCVVVCDRGVGISGDSERVTQHPVLEPCSVAETF